METLPLLLELGVATAMAIVSIVSIFLTAGVYSSTPLTRGRSVSVVYRSSTAGMLRKHSCKPGVGTTTTRAEH